MAVVIHDKENSAFGEWQGDFLVPCTGVKISQEAIFPKKGGTKNILGKGECAAKVSWEGVRFYRPHPSYK